MSRSRRRISRTLVAALAITLVAGVVTLIVHHRNSASAEKIQEAGTTVVRRDAVRPDMPVKPAGAQVTLVSTTPAPAADVAVPEALHSAGPTTPDVHRSMAMVTTAPLSTRPLIDGKAKMESGDLLGARRILNNALLGGQLSEAESTQAKEMISQISQKVVFSRQIFPDDPFGGSYTVKSGDSLAKIASHYDVPWQLLADINQTEPRRLRAGATIKIVKGPFHAVVTKGKFTIDLYLGSPGEAGSMYVTTYRVGLGKSDSTPTGLWLCEPHKKIRHPVYYSPRGEGIIQAGDPKNPLGGYWIGLEGVDGHAVGKQSYGIHGTIDPDSIGKQDSLGCIRLGNGDIEKVFEMLLDGKSTVRVKP